MILLPLLDLIFLIEMFLQVTTPLLFKLIPNVMNLGVLLQWFPSESGMQNEVLSLSLSLCLCCVCVMDIYIGGHLRAYTWRFACLSLNNILRFF